MGEDQIKGSIITNLDQSFQGRVAGVTSVATSGAPVSYTHLHPIKTDKGWLHLAHGVRGCASGLRYVL